MPKNDKLLVEAIDTMLSHKAQLGLQDPPQDKKEEDEHTFQFLHEQINEMFAIKAAGLTHHDGVCAAFRKVHNFKYVTDPVFTLVVDREMSSQGIPAEEREKVTKFIPAIIDEVKKQAKSWEERDAGFHPQLDEIIKVSRPGVKNES